MSEFYHEKELERERSEDYYAGYYWGNNPYDSNELAGRMNDEELKGKILKHGEKWYDELRSNASCKGWCGYPNWPCQHL